MTQVCDMCTIHRIDTSFCQPGHKKSLVQAISSSLIRLCLYNNRASGSLRQPQGVTEHGSSRVVAPAFQVTDQLQQPTQ
jgi:hypothetical protein